MTPMAWHEDEFARLAGATDRLPHALLVRGARGIGKLAFAQALAQALLCESPTADGHACDACGACAWFAAGAHPDYRQIEPESADESEGGEEGEARQSGKKPKTAILIHQVRALADFVVLSSHRGGPKIIVVHPAEAMNPNAANALLKNLEEPPPRTHFVLVTHRPHQLLPTIKSRCRQVALSVPSTSDAIAWLAAKGVRNAELALAHTGNAPLLALELDDSEYWGARAAFLRHLCAPDLDVLSAADAARDLPIPNVVAWLQKWSYDIVSHHTLGTIRYNPDQRDALARTAAQVDALAALRFHREMVKLQPVVHHPLNARLFVEHLLLAYRDLIRPPAATSP